MQFKSMLAASAMAASFLMAAHSANASTLLFTFTGDLDASFTLGSDPTPSSADSDGAYFANYPITFFGSSVTLSKLEIFSSTDLGGLDGLEADSTIFDLYGPQVFSGDTSAPHFATGTFDLANSSGCTQDPGGQGCAFTTLTITDAVAGAVPEPAEWALLIAGAGLAGATLRMRRRKVAGAATA